MAGHQLASSQPENVGPLTMELSYAPRSQVAAWLGAGWRLVPGHEYVPGDRSILMVFAPGMDLPAGLADKLSAAPPPPRLNLSAAATSRNRTRSKAKPLDPAIRIDPETKARLALGLRPQCSVVLGILLRCGMATYGAIEERLYDDADGGPDNITGAIRSVVKHLRRALRRQGVVIKTYYGFGWTMDEANRAKCRRLVQESPC